MPPPGEDNKRVAHRKAGGLAVDLSISGRYHSGRLRDISTGGAFIDTRTKASPGDAVVITLAHPEFPRPFKFSGVVARTDANGIGIRFDKFNHAQNEKLEVLVDRIRGGWL